MKSKYWKEKWIGDYALYCGFLNKHDYRLGISLGNKESSVDLLIFTFGFMR